MIPEIEEFLGEKKAQLKKIILTSLIIVILFYLVFIFIILGSLGFNTTPTALPGLTQIFGEKFGRLGLFFGLITTFTSFIVLGLTLKEIFCYDLKIKKNLAWVLACFIPFFIFLIGLKSFITVISLIGGVMLGIDGILILLMYKKIKPRKIFLIYLLTLIFLGGIIYELINFFL